MTLNFVKSCFVFCSLLSSIPALSQLEIKPGVRLGANIASLSNFEDESGTALYGGPLLNLHFNRVYELQPELMYSKYIVKSKEKNFSDLSSSYLTFGVTNKMFLKETGLHLLLGGSVDFNVGSDWSKIDNNGNYSKINVTKSDVSFYGGIGCELPFGLGVEARFKKNYTSADSDDYEKIGNGVATSTGYEKKLKMLQAIQVGVYYKINRKK